MRSLVDAAVVLIERHSLVAKDVCGALAILARSPAHDRAYRQSVLPFHSHIPRRFNAKLASTIDYYGVNYFRSYPYRLWL